MGYAELHCRSNFSFLTGASHPEHLVEVAGALGLDALAMTDRNGVYGIVRFAEAARAIGLPTVFGVEIDCGTFGDIVLLSRGASGYGPMVRAVSEGQLAGKKGAPVFMVDAIAHRVNQQCVVLTGGYGGAVVRALTEHGPLVAESTLRQLVESFGRDNVLVELWDHGDPIDAVRNDQLVQIAHRVGVECVATNNVMYAVPAQHRVATALAAVQNRCGLDEIDYQLPPAATAYLRSEAEMHRRFVRYPGVVERACVIAREIAFDLSLVAPKLPPFPCPDGHDEMSFLRALVQEGARRRYGDKPDVGEEDLSLRSRAWRTIDHELAIIESLGFAGYFLVVWDIVRFCEEHDILCQGRGSAANSAVCFSLGITKADAVSLGLLFERFLSPERDGPPDIDIDIESGRREEVIQYVYQRHGRLHAAQVANVITYRSRSAVRDMARALGYSPTQQDAWSKQVDAWSDIAVTTQHSEHNIPDLVLEMASHVEHMPRHLGIHSGGMVLCDRPIIEVCPVEWARRENRSVLQWDKDDCAAAGLVKFDLLGLGMLTALHNTVDAVAEAYGFAIDIAEVPQDDAVYDMLCVADSVGVFQVESRAQMATLPRLKPRKFYDLVVEVALIRPGPIQGNSVHPYIRRRNGLEKITYLHPLLEPSLAKTLGIPLFQEQLMQMAIDIAGFSPGEADQLRQAMGSKRSSERMECLRGRLFEGMAERGITGDIAEQIFDKLAAFANFGFPESHSVSFAYLVYSSSYLKRYFPAAFCAGLLNAQPMGFYSPHTLVADARRHGVAVRTPDLAASGVGATLEWVEGRAATTADVPFPIDAFPVGGVEVPQPAVRLGLSSVRSVGDELAECIVTERETNGPYASMTDLAQRIDIDRTALEAMATAGVFSNCTDRSGTNLDRRRALWVAGAVAETSADRLPGIVTGADAPSLPGLSDRELAGADLWATGVSPDGHPTLFEREHLASLGVLTAAELRTAPTDTRVLVGGVVTHRQRPSTAHGITFVNLEDETGLINVVCSPGLWKRYRRVARGAPALLVRGRLERIDGVINVVADKLEVLPVVGGYRSRDFR